jgi:hypothetical protein
VEEPRLPAHLEVGGLIRRVQSAGGFATVIHKGEPEQGTLMLVLVENGANARVYERMPGLDGSRRWHCSKQEVADNPREITEYLARRSAQDSDLWIVELDIAQAERFIR